MTVGTGNNPISEAGDGKNTEEFGRLRSFLESIRERGGTRVLTEMPYQVHRTLLEKNACSPRAACILLSACVSGAASLAASGASKELVADCLKSECFMQRKAADRIAALLCQTLFEKHPDDKPVLSDFCAANHVLEANAEATWQSASESDECSVRASATISIQNDCLVREETKGFLSDYPDAGTEAISEYYEKDLNNKLSDELQAFVSAHEDPPSMEDFAVAFDSMLESFCEKHGFKLEHRDYDWSETGLCTAF